jgi:phosphoglycolate phosphatase-like HAD superfamily hydrolase
MRHVVWDWNGTLFDDLDIVVASVNESLKSLGAGPIDVTRYAATYRRPLHLFYETLLDRTVAPEEMATIDRVFHDAYQALLDGARLTVDARVAVGMVARRGWTQSVLSMWWHDRLVPAVRHFGLEDHMLAVDGHRGAPGESKECHLTHHVEQLIRLFPVVSRETLVVIGDVTDDADAARAAGVACVLYDGGSQPRADLEASGVPVASSLVEALELTARQGAVAGVGVLGSRQSSGLTLG